MKSQKAFNMRMRSYNYFVATSSDHIVKCQVTVRR